ncbi:MAG: DNA-binding domain-containing protein, partial [Rhodocyclaceae bacterium]|nr:DNA-binding domain-containing protein [Rhodocyclaceae bacterium]
QYEHAGTLGELVVQADQASVAHELGGDPAKAMAAPKHALQRKLLDGLRFLLREEFKLNQPQASDGWLTQDALWLVSKTVSDKLRAHLLSQGIDGIPSNNTAVFNVLQDHGIVQPTADGKAIWKATVTSDNGWSHSFTFLRLAPALIWDTGERPGPFAGTVRIEEGEASPEAGPSPAVTAAVDAAPVAVAPDIIPADPFSGLLEMLGDPPTSLARPSPDTSADAEPPAPPPPAAAAAPADIASIAPEMMVPSTIEPSGEHFVAWLRHGIHTRKLIINDVKALVHTVADTAYLVSPGVFQRYAQEHPAVAKRAKEAGLTDWQWVQKRFERLQLHRKQPSGLNIWTCEVTGPRKSRRLHGYLLTTPDVLFENTSANNPYLHLIEST